MTKKRLNPEIKKFKLSDLNPADYNPREITDEALEGLSNSIQRFGCVEPIVVNTRGGKNIIVGGHQRYKALEKLGVKECICVTVSCSSSKEKLLNISLNNPEIQGRFIDTIEQYIADMTAEIDDEQAMVDLRIKELIGEIDVVKEGLTDDDEVPEVPEKPRTKKRDLYILGDHRLLCGDSTNAEDVERLMDGQKADMVFTSPPYWVGFEYENEKDKKSILTHIDISSQTMTKFTKGKIVINTGNISSITKAEKITGKKQPALLIDWWMDAMNKNNFMLRHIRIWAKMGGVMPSRANDKIDMHWEYLATFTDESGNAGFIATFKDAADDTGQNTGTPAWAVNGVWSDITGKARGSNHVAAFPVELPLRYLIIYTKREMLCYEPYCSSGSTMIACEKLGRRCFGMEIDEHYCDVIVKRWEDFTGLKAKRQRKGSKK